MDDLVVALRQVRHRLALRQWVDFTVHGLFLSASAGCLWLLAARLFPVLGAPEIPCLALLAGAFLTAAVLAAVRRPTLAQAALATDRHLGLDERLTTSHALADAEGPMIEAVHRDARVHLPKGNWSKHFPLTTAAALRRAYLPVAVLCLAYLFLPELDLFRYRERLAKAAVLQQAIQAKAERIKAVVRPIREATPEQAGKAAASADKIERIAEDFQAGDITEKQMQARLSNVAKELQKQREGMRESTPEPKVAGDTAQLGGATRELADAIKEGNLRDAAGKARELGEKLKAGTMSDAEKAALGEDLKKLADMLGGEETELGKALADALGKLGGSGDSSGSQLAGGALDALELSLEDIAAMLEQCRQTEMLLANLSQMTLNAWGGGSGAYGMYGMGGMNGMWGAGAGMGMGMGGPGRGRGGMAGELPDIDVDFQPAMLPGEKTKGKIIASILVDGAPDEDAESTLDYVAGAFTQVKQEAEQALTKEEIPPGAKEFVRQYFGTLELEDNAKPK